MGSENPVRPEAEEDKWDTVRTSVDDLYTLLDTYFPPNPDDKLSKLQAESDACLSLLDSIPYEQRKSSSQRALYEYLRGNFFITGAWEHNKLRQALKAYQIAEKDERTHSNPDLFFNCATVNKYLENYERALTGFEAAALRDPSLDAAEEVQKMVNLLDRIQSLLRVSRIIHAIRNQFLSFSDLQVKSPYKEATIDVLAPGLNKSVMVAGKVLFFVKHDDATPLYYVVCDSNHASFVLSVYGVRNEAIKEGDRIALLEPHCHHLDFSWKAKHYDFKSIRVDFVEQVVVNGKPLTAHHAVSSSIYAQHKP
ncbi:Tetratricopeptide repeat protein 5 [Linum perenne]